MPYLINDKNIDVCVGEFEILRKEFGEKVLQALERRYPKENFPLWSEFRNPNEKFGIYDKGENVRGSSPQIIGAINTILAEGFIPGWEKARVPHRGRVFLACNYGDLRDRVMNGEGSLVLSDKDGPNNNLRDDLANQLLEVGLVSDINSPIMISGYGLETANLPDSLRHIGYRFTVLPNAEVTYADTLWIPRTFENHFFQPTDPHLFLYGTPIWPAPYEHSGKVAYPLHHYESGLTAVSFFGGALSADMSNLTASNGAKTALIERDPSAISGEVLQKIMPDNPLWARVRKIACPNVPRVKKITLVSSGIDLS